MYPTSFRPLNTNSACTSLWSWALLTFLCIFCLVIPFKWVICSSRAFTFINTWKMYKTENFKQYCIYYVTWKLIQKICLVTKYIWFDNFFFQSGTRTNLRYKICVCFCCKNHKFLILKFNNIVFHTRTSIHPSLQTWQKIVKPVDSKLWICTIPEYLNIPALIVYSHQTLVYTYIIR